MLVTVARVCTCSAFRDILPLGEATPESPEAMTTETPCKPSFMNSLHWRCW